MQHAIAFALAILSAVGPAGAMEPGRLTLWLGQGQGFPDLAQVADAFTAETGAQVTVLRPDDAESRFEQLAAAGAGPDILVTSHEHLGDWVARRLLARLAPNPAFRSLIAGIGWQAVTLAGVTYGYPISIDSISLIYNKDIVKQPPKSFEEIPALDRDLQRGRKRALIWDYRTPQFTFPLLAANGGYAFRRSPDGGYDPRDTGIDNLGSRIGARYLRSLIDVDILPRELDYAAAQARFGAGEVALTIDGPWAWDNLDKRGIRYGVAPLPTLNGKPARGYFTVTAAVLNAASPNKELATRLIEHHLLTPNGLRAASGDRLPAAVSLKTLQEQLGQDPRSAVTFEGARNGEPVPNTPAMVTYWTVLDEAIARIASGRMSADQALEAAAARLRPGGCRGLGLGLGNGLLSDLSATRGSGARRPGRPRPEPPSTDVQHPSAGGIREVPPVAHQEPTVCAGPATCPIG
jgi:maltose/maltodextrin transport system substrate-binding protein